MLLFFGDTSQKVFVVESTSPLSQENTLKLQWLFGEAPVIDTTAVSGEFIGPRATMITPWSTNAVEITQNMGIKGIVRIEEYFAKDVVDVIDPMLVVEFNGLNQSLFTVDIAPEKVIQIQDIAAYNQQEGLALSQEEIDYLNKLAKSLGRPLTDSEVFGFSQVNSEHCRHKIFNGTFIIDGETKESSLFQLIKKTSKENPNSIVSAYKDNVAFIEGPAIEQFAPSDADQPSSFKRKSSTVSFLLKQRPITFPPQ